MQRLGEQRPGQLDRDEHQHGDRGDRHRRLRGEQQHPAGLGDHEGDDHLGAERPAGGVLSAGPQPLEHHRQPHDHVAGDHQLVVEVLVVVHHRLEHPRQPEGEHQHADHLHHRREPERPVVGVVGRGEPREVDPGPGHREARQEEGDHTLPTVVLGERVRQLVGRRTERDDEGQVEEQLERRGRASVLVRVAPGHPAYGVPQLRHARKSRFRDVSRLAAVRQWRRGWWTGWSATRCRACGRRARGATPPP